MAQQTQNPVFNQVLRQSYYALSITVTTTPALLISLLETQLEVQMGYAAGSLKGMLAKIWREVQLQVDPETSAGLSVRLGLGNLGSTVNSVVQKGITLVGQSDTIRAPFNNVDLSMMWCQAVSGSPILNVQLWAE